MLEMAQCKFETLFSRFLTSENDLSRHKKIQIIKLFLAENNHPIYQP
jgi:hypothetical protein